MKPDRRRIALVIGTRPEAIKLAPIARELARADSADVVTISSGQHADLLDQTISSLGLAVDHELGVMTHDQTPIEILTRVIAHLSALMESLKPDILVIQGDTTTVLGAGLAAYHMRIPIAHVEAGLRTYDHDNPFPEEANRQLVDRLAWWCFAPTEQAKANLLAERIAPDRIHVTGNTAVDNLLWMADRVHPTEARPDYLLVTLHRRESFGDTLREIMLGVADFVRGSGDASVIWPVHPNPNILTQARSVFDGMAGVELRGPADYREFVGLLKSARLILTDSGGIQEEAPSLGKTVLVARETTERPEALAFGRNRLVGRTRAKIHDELVRAWTDPPYRGVVPAPNPFGDGHAASRIVDVLTRDEIPPAGVLG